MMGLYFINTNIANYRAHTSQILNTTAILGRIIPLTLVAPRYGSIDDKEELKKRHGLDFLPEMALLSNFGLSSPSAVGFILFNIPAIIYLLRRKFSGEAGFIYIRSTLFLPLVFMSKILGVPIIYETHRVPQSSTENFRDRIISKLSRGIVVISDHVRTYYEQYGKPILVVHDAVSLERFGVDINKIEARKNYGLLPRDKVGVYTGTVSRLKGVQYLVSAAKLMPGVKFLLAGIISGDFRDYTWPENITILGQREQAELPAILRSGDVLVLPHPDNEYSQSPMKLFEYMASGVPIVSSRLSSLTEVLNDANSVLVEAENPEALKAGIEKVLDDSLLASRIALEAKRNAEEYTWEKRGKRIADFIKQEVSN